MPGGGLITPLRFLPHHSDLTGDLLAFPAGHFQDVSFHGMLEAAGDGAIMAGPVGPTPPMLDGGEWTHLLAEAPHSRAQGMVRSAPNRRRGKRRSQLVTKRIITCSLRGHKPCVSGR
jgi:hypothetical protein